MKNIFKSFYIIVAALAITSCNKSDDSSTEVKDYSEQYQKDLELIEDFLQTHYMEVTNNPGATDDQSVTFTEIPTGGTQTSIWNQTDYPLQVRYVNKHDITYKLYYIQLRQGTGATSKSPCNVDQVLASYNGKYIYTDSDTEKTTFEQFEESLNPQTYFSLASVIAGWSEIFPKFKTGSYSANPDGTISYFDFGAGVMFIPSGLGYYNVSTGGIPSYSPLIFSFKLYEIIREDQDSDGIPSYQEDISTVVVNSDGTETVINGTPDGYVRVLDEDEVNPDDTDGDDIPDFLDIDDDGDYFTTLSEIKNPLTGDSYPYADIPTCTDGKKKHLSTACH